MLKIELIYRELLYRTIEKSNPDFSLTELSRKFKLSTSVVSHALLPLRVLGIIKIGKLNSSVIDTERLLYFWATKRSVDKDIIYKTYSPLPVLERESLLPKNVRPTAYSYCRMILNEKSADYEHIYFYTQDKKNVLIRFPENPKHPPNIFLLKEDPYLSSYPAVPLAQVFADLWNLPEWYAKDYSQSVFNIIKGKIGL